MNIFRLPYTLRSFESQKIVQGCVTIGRHSDRTVMLNVQPVEGTELKQLPEGVRSSKSIKAYGDFQIQTADTKQKKKADRLLYNGEWYECVASHLREHTPLKHFKSYFVRLSEASEEDFEEGDESEYDY